MPYAVSMMSRPCSAALGLFAFALALHAACVKAADSPSQSIRLLNSEPAAKHGYDGVKTVCLYQTSASYCPYDEGQEGKMAFGAIRTELACCSTKDTTLDPPPLMTESAGRCEWTWISDDSSYSDATPHVRGSFSVLCYLSSQAEGCVEPYCKDMVISAQGSIYFLQDLVTDDPSPNVIDTCSGPGKQNMFWGNSSHVQNTGRSKKEPKGTVQYRDESKLWYEVYYACIFSGPMTIHSMEEGSKWSGWFQSVWSMLTDTKSTISAGEAATRQMIRPNDINLNIYVGHQHY